MNMKRRSIFIGDMPVKVNDEDVQGAFVELDGERYYKISNADRMPDFFMSIVSASDHWMFISSNGSLSAGRKNSENALFPYYSEDKIHDYRGKTGSRTLILVKKEDGMKLWEPFEGDSAGAYSLKRNIYKNLSGNKLVFEEINEDLELTFRYGWYNSDRFGFIKRSVLSKQGTGPVQVELLDGLQNILPCSVDSGLQLSSSNLLDAYKRQELLSGTTLGIFRLSSVPSDAAVPSEALKVNTVWSEGLNDSTILLSSLQLDAFRKGYPIEQEYDVKATRGSYFAYATLELTPEAECQWNIVAEVNQDAAGVAGLLDLLKSGLPAGELVQKDIEKSNADLSSLLASSDALQCTEDELSTTRHLSNVLFNVMRGGVFPEHYQLPAKDFLAFVSNTNGSLLQEAETLLDGCGEKVNYMQLLEKARNVNNPMLIRVCYEYLALTFSRRHGDPSRPWNKFSIDNRKADGSKNLDYQGNWRDIFQNWEALALSYPGYIESMISKFVNASTADGYNPYRITRNGIDWEVPDPSDPWSNIGYWGDHQVVYLLKFLEISVNHHPGELQQLLSRELFTYANVPYRIKPYSELLDDPHNTILFDDTLEAIIKTRVETIGSDGRLVWDKNEQVVFVNLAEKLLVTLLSKLSNFIPGAGIWMNTQRPEWNDANNALVGYGVSMVTTYYLRAFIGFCRELFGSSKEALRLTEEVATFFTRMKKAMDLQADQVEDMLTRRGMKTCMDLFGEAGSDFRQLIYREGFSGKHSEVGVNQFLEFFDDALRVLDQSILSNRRDDRLYHAYNLINVDGDQLVLRRLYEMLEGQVAVLSSGYLKIEEAIDLLDALKSSKLFREDQYSYILYPDRILPSFMDINNIPADKLNRSELLKRLLQRNDRRILVQDVNEVNHFHADFRNGGLLNQALDALPEEYHKLLEKERDLILSIYEEVFDHQSFTGRSGTFYGYEGLGSIYWHMVSKLLLAVCETYYRAAEGGANPEFLGRLVAHYYEIRAGIGLNKAPEVYGAFPTDPYSHTPGNRGAQQPGMTGQVKEDIIARWGELGLLVRNGTIHFMPILLRKEEFLSQSSVFNYVDVNGARKTLPLEKDTLAFTYCQVPVKYHLSEEQLILLHFNDGTEQQIAGTTIEREQSAMIFERNAEIILVEVWLFPGL
jgi:hypothetical protein